MREREREGQMANAINYNLDRRKFECRSRGTRQQRTPSVGGGARLHLESNGPKIPTGLYTSREILINRQIRHNIYDLPRICRLVRGRQKVEKRTVILPRNFHISRRDKCYAFGRNDPPTNKLRAFLSGPMNAGANASEASR